MTRLQDFYNDLRMKDEMNDEQIEEYLRYELTEFTEGVKPEWVSVREDLQKGILTVWDNEDATSKPISIMLKGL